MTDRIWIALASLLALDVALGFWLWKTGVKRKPRRPGLYGQGWGKR